jgi:hypothetical protein
MQDSNGEANIAITSLEKEKDEVLVQLRAM